MLEVHSMITGMAQEYCYAVVNEDKQALIFDPGDQAGDLMAWIDGNGWKPQAILLTHAHYDHIGAVDALRDYYDLPVYIHPNEADWLTNPELNLSAYTGGPLIRLQPADHLWESMGDKSVGNFEFQLAFVPGHSPGHVIYYFAEAGFVIAGDTLFQGSIGRTDLPGGDTRQLLEGIGRELLTLPGETKVYSGHTPVTTIQAERATNPFLQGFRG